MNKEIEMPRASEDTLFRTTDTDLATYLIEIKGAELTAPPEHPPIVLISDGKRESGQWCLKNVKTEWIGDFRADRKLQRYLSGKRQLLRLLHEVLGVGHRFVIPKKRR